MRTLICISLLLSLGATAGLPAAPRPNIVVILVDDMGFSDISCYGGEIPTPNIDRLAQNGLRFTQFYNVARCCPSRAAILTGLYSHQTGVGHMIQDDQIPGYRGFLNDNCVTIAEALRPAGYFTATAGKWHVGSAPEHWPDRRGFDRSYSALTGGFYYRPATKGQSLVRDGKVLYSPELPPPAGWYSTDAWTDQGVGFVDEALAAKKPFFLYLPYNAPHFPLQAPPEEIAAWRGKFLRGWDQLREERYARQVKLGIVDPAWRLSPRETSFRPGNVAAWASLTDAEKDRFDHIMAIYAAVLQHLDRSIGRLVEALKERGVLDDTLILFLSDNGGNAESGPRGRLEGASPGSVDSTVYLGQSWASLSNTPYRFYKHYDYEGGISTPLIAHWPARIADGGRLTNQLGHIVDIMATCLDAAGATYPQEFAGKPILPTEGRSLLPAFSGTPFSRGALYWEHEGNAAVREGDWKLVRLGQKGSWELYNVKVDRTELNNLAASESGRAKDLAAKWEAWAKRTHVYPLPGARAKSGNPE